MDTNKRGERVYFEGRSFSLSAFVTYFAQVKAWQKAVDAMVDTMAEVARGAADRLRDDERLTVSTEAGTLIVSEKETRKTLTDSRHDAAIEYVVSKGGACFCSITGKGWDVLAGSPEGLDSYVAYTVGKRRVTLK